MRLKNYRSTLEEQLAEFDIWVTPSLGEIRDSPQFKSNFADLKKGFNYLAEITSDFAEIDCCTGTALATKTLAYIAHKSKAEAKDILDSVFHVLLLATGKTDNHLKCQFPLILRKEAETSTIPRKKADGTWKDEKVPRVFLLNDVAKTIVQLDEQILFQKTFAESYFCLIVSDLEYAKQVWSLGNAYTSQKKVHCADSLIASIVVFQSRGSIAASQGHIPENILRNYMQEWGLKAGTDFNINDVEVGELLGSTEIDNKVKKRKYDFIIPFQSKTSGAKIFIQSQFYAGDSGSVSHKVVDQTDSTREATLSKFHDAVFLEYLDGAGYFSSLNGDLRKMLAKPTTADFFQVKTAPLKLRRALQGIFFLTPLEIEHAVIRCSGKKDEVIKILREEQYSEEEINRALTASRSSGHIYLDEENNILQLNPKRISTIRKYCILDVIANYGKQLSAGKAVGCLMVAGYAVAWGLPQNEVIRLSCTIFSGRVNMWSNVQEVFDDIQWLLSNGFVIAR